MTDIVERLRAVDHMMVEDCFLQSHLFAQAADEIERLRAEAARLRAEIVLLEAVGAEASDEIDRLREALRQIAEMGAPAECERIARAALAAKGPGHE